MDFSVNDLRGLSTVFCMLAFGAVVFWAYGPSRKQYFDQAAALPFEDEPGSEESPCVKEDGKVSE